MKIFKIKSGIDKTKVTILGICFSIKHNYEKFVAQNYARKLIELQKEFGKRKIKVGFLVSEPAKWQYQSLYEEMEKSDLFEPVVLVTNLLIKCSHNFYKTIEECFRFFELKKLNVRYVYDLRKKKFISAKNFGVDILFYQQPWGLDDSQHPVAASKYALTGYVPYGLHFVKFNESYMSDFHLLLWKMFIENSSQIEWFSQLARKEVSNCLVVGYPKLDAYLNMANVGAIDKHKPLLIYAPHHSFEKDGLNCATFHKNGMDILALAQKYREQIDWIFKPHPRFKTAVINNIIMSNTEIDDYYTAWQQIGTVYECGDYIDLFKQSDGMITDCISFLGEYLPTGKPIFHLLGESRPFNDFAKSIIVSYYQIENIAELDSIFNQVIINHEDIKKEERCSRIPLLFDRNEKSASKIISKLNDSLRR